MTDSTVSRSLSDIEKYFPVLLGNVSGDRDHAADQVNFAFKQIDIYRKAARKKSLANQQILSKR